MGRSTDGEISYGVLFDEGYEFPWQSQDLECDDLDAWWLGQTGFVRQVESPYDENDQYRPGIQAGDPRVAQYHDEEWAWQKAHPFPFQLVNTCSCECPHYVLALPSSVRTAGRGYPKTFDPAKLVVDPAEVEALLAFCVKYELKYAEGPAWFLSSYTD